MNDRLTTTTILCAFCALAATAAAAAPEAASGGSRARADLQIVSQDAAETRALPYDKLLIDPIAISYHPASSNRRLKPEHAARLGEAASQAIRTAAGEQFTVVDATGPGVLRIRAAITNIRAEHKRKRFWNYTPFGFVKARVDAATGRDIELVTATVEVELYDSLSGRRLSAVADLAGDDASNADAELSFRKLIAKVGGWTKRLLAELETA